MNKLVIQDDEGRTTVVPLIREEVTIGRKEGNTIRLTERNVSRRHARIVRSNGVIYLEDLGSYNGVRVNGARIEGRCALAVSDRVQIGDYLIELRSDDADHAAAALAAEKETQRIERVEVAPPAAVEATGSARAAVARSAAAETAAGEGSAPPPPPATAPLAAKAPAQAGASNGEATAPDSEAAAEGVTVAEPVSTPAQEPTPSGTEALLRPAPSPPARFVILSTSLAGREFVLDGREMLVGRTDENDVVINHRSISRHHAKLVNQGGRYTIIDLQSSNGVRVNGEDYAKVELRRGDVVDLGHVRLRFVEPGEKFTFDRQAHAVDLVSGENKRGVLWAMLTLLLVGAGLVVLVMGRGQGKSARALVNAPGQIPATATPASLGDPTRDPAGRGQTGFHPTSNPSAAAAAHGATADGVANPAPYPAATPGQAAPAKQVEDLLAAALQALEKEKWELAREAADKALELEEENPKAGEIFDRADKELNNYSTFTQLSQAARAKDHGAVIRLLAAIENDSVYRSRAQAQHDRSRDEYVAAVATRAQRLTRAGKCKELRRLAAETGKLWREAGGAVSEHSAACREKPRAATAPAAAERRPVVRERVEERPAPLVEPERNQVVEDEKPPHELTAEAQEAVKTGQFGKALRLCSEALAKKRVDQQAATVCVIASCNLRDARKAKRYFALLREADLRGMVRQICFRLNVPLE